MKTRDLILYLSLKHNGDWDKIYNSIKGKEYMHSTEVQQIIDENKVKFITILDDDYPKCFKNIYRPPFVLFYKGDINLLNEKRLLGIVGTRNPSDYGTKMTKRLVDELDDDVIVVSGLAKGIDSIAHKQCLLRNKKTIAFLGCGINYIYPTENYQLYKDIEENGLILSEYPDMVSPDKEHFPFRNRLIAAVSKGVCAVEAKNKSGTSSTITAAASYGKTIFAVFNPITDENDSLPNDLICDGAIPVRCGNDINEEI